MAISIPRKKVPQAPAADVNPFAQYDNFSEEFEKLLTNFMVIERKAATGRKIRQCRVDTEALKASGLLQANETYIAVRLIDENITREMPARLAYLKSAQRLAIFESQDNRIAEYNTDIQSLESEFWRVMTYPGWELDYVRTIDGAELLGYDFVEVRFDTSKEGHVCIEHVGQDFLVHDQNIQCLEDSSIVARAYNITPVSLRRLARENNFNQTITKSLLEQADENKTSEQVSLAHLKIYHVFFKDDNGVVYHAWFSKDENTWLAEPKMFYRGVDVQREVMSETLPPEIKTVWKPAAETMYPFVMLSHKITEQMEISKIPGRVDEDYYMQEAASTTLSAFVNGNTTAANVMWAPDGNAMETSTAAPKQTSLQIKQGAIWNQPMKAFNAPYPDPSLPRSLEFLLTRNAEANAQISYATNNRVDSRKTAAEVNQASKENAQLSGAQVLYFSIFLRDIYIRSWQIIQSQALQNLITFLPNPAPAQPGMQAPAGNQTAIISRDWTIKPAGDTDYVERAARIQKMQQDWPMIQQTPIAMMFAQDYLRLQYPDRAGAYIQQMASAQAAQEQQTKQLLGNVAGMLKEAVTEPDGKLKPEWQAHAAALQQLGQQVQAILAPPKSPAQPAQ